MTVFSDRVNTATRFNPFNVQEGDQVYQLFVDCQATLYDGQSLDWCGRISLSPDVGELETAATIAFMYLREQGLPAPLMSLCTFYFWDEDAEGWRQFL